MVMEKRSRESSRRWVVNHDLASAPLARTVQYTGRHFNRLKVESSIQNAKAVIEVIRDYGSFNSFLWDSIGDKPIVNKYKSSSEIPPYNVTSEQLSKKLKDRGFNFVGPKIVYSFMQATGLLNDHITSCYRHKDLL